jgi:hypothetical protein
MHASEHDMKAKQLEAIVGTELGLGEAEMVQRFQRLRDMQLLPVSRGRNAEHLTRAGIVCGLLSVVAERPGFAGQTTKILCGLRPVGGPKKGFGQAATFAEALEAALNNETLLNSVLEIRITDSEIYTNSNGRGVIVYRRDGDDCEHKTYYVRSQAVSLLQEGAEETYNPRDLISSMIRETVVHPHILKRIAHEVREVERHVELLERLDKQARPHARSDGIR